MKHFYFVADYTAKYYLNVDNILISAGSGWIKGKWFDWGLTNIKRLFVDSGGFSFFKKWGEYPFDVETYIEHIHQLSENNNLELCATRDYPCEIEVDRTEYKTNQDRIDATIKGAIECYDTDSKLPWIPVIQGYTLNEYSDCYRRYTEQGIKSNYWAIGSVCARKGNRLSIRKIITAIHKLTGAKLHAFGLSLSYLVDPQINNALYSSDSAAWNWGISRHEDKSKAVAKYLKMINRLQIQGTQLTLDEY